MRSLEEGMAFLRKMIQATYGSGQQEDRPQNLSEVIASSVAACVPTARQAGVDLIYNLPDELGVCLDTHPLDTGRVVQNLVDNAVRYTKGFPNPWVIESI
jgi:signal transduction histidine kinase